MTAIPQTSPRTMSGTSLTDILNWLFEITECIVHILIEDIFLFPRYLNPIFPYGRGLSSLLSFAWEIPNLPPKAVFLKQGFPFLFHYHPALGPAFSIISQKVKLVILFVSNSSADL